MGQPWERLHQNAHRPNFGPRMPGLQLAEFAELSLDFGRDHHRPSKSDTPMDNTVADAIDAVADRMAAHPVQEPPGSGFVICEAQGALEDAPAFLVVDTTMPLSKPDALVMGKERSALG